MSETNTLKSENEDDWTTALMQNASCSSTSGAETDYVAESRRGMEEFLDQFPNTVSLTGENRVAFLTDDDFNYLVAAKRTAEEAIGWRQVPENVVYRVDKLTPIQTKWGFRHIVQLRNANGHELKAWAPTNVARDLKSGFKLNGTDCLAFIKSLGENETDVAGERKRKFADFETVYLP